METMALSKNGLTTSGQIKVFAAPSPTESKWTTWTGTLWMATTACVSTVTGWWYQMLPSSKSLIGLDRPSSGPMTTGRMMLLEQELLKFAASCLEPGLSPMSSAKKFAPDIDINPTYLVTLKAMEYESYKWGLSAAGLRPAHNNPASRMFARDLQKQALENYFNAIEQLIPKKSADEVS